MVRVNFFKDGDMLYGFECKGHTGIAESGEDIVCSFISSACYMTANTVTEVMGLKADARDCDGFMRLCIKESPKKVQDILNGLMLHLSALAEDYPKNINISITEV